MILSNANERTRFSSRCGEFKNELDLDPKLNWKENWFKNKNITDKWKKIEANLFPEYNNYVDTIESVNYNNLSELYHITIFYDINIYQICIWYVDIYNEFLLNSNLLDLNEDNQFLVIRDLHYDDNEEGYCGSDLDDYLRCCGYTEDDIKKRNKEGLEGHNYFYSNRRKLLSDRLKINTISEIRKVFNHFLCPTVKFRLSIPGVCGIRSNRSGYPKSIEDLNRVYNDLKNGKPF